MTTERRAWEANQEDTSIDRLGELLADRSPWVRAAAVSNEKTPMTLVAKLLSDGDREVRSALVVRAVQELALLELILREGSVLLRTQLSEDAARSTETNRDLVEAIREVLPQQSPADRWKLQLQIDRWNQPRPILSLDVQQRLAEDDAWQVRAAIGALTHHAEVLARLVADPSPKVRVRCLNNDLLTAEQVDRLLHDASRDVRAWVAGSAPLTPAQMDDVAQHDRSVDVLDMLIHRKDVSAQILRRLAGHTNADLAYAARLLLEEQSR
jgi:hypothetical protein